MGIYGQDWSSYQDSQPDTSGLSFAFVKVTEGLGYVNPEWVSQRDHAKANGLVWGAYHYPHMHNSDRSEADFFLSQVAWQPGDLVVLDWEGYDSANQDVGAADQLAYKEDYLAYLKSRLPNNPTGLYCNLDYWNRVDTTGHVGDFLWIATAGRGAGDPGIRASWLFHQYSDNPVDSDYCYLGSTDELRSWALSFTPQTTPTPAPPPVEEDPLAAFTEADLRRFIHEETLNAVTSAPGRDAVAFAVCWWLQKALTGTPVPTDAGQPWADLLPKLTAALNSLSPAVRAELEAAIATAVKDATVHVTVSDTSTTPPTKPPTTV
ncbi:glycoside hydrolase family 25 protein [Kitasatospora sp. MAP5-34]|uniref:glycoside hydrolase family 25 protein n=1 Tax=Kitasatospora sp. MAP5-34 TaxID=3035102 RepID=UPI00247307A9|nr:glycoside hydrolase family 25 protein [Kitasatospora sp. MAP5-34]MDH6579219.1 hypothetical protein [Kitasatospora sp. MAP5-34]